MTLKIIAKTEFQIVDNLARLEPLKYVYIDHFTSNIRVVSSHKRQ